MAAKLRGWDDLQGQWEVPIEDAVIFTDEKFVCEKAPSMEMENSHDYHSMVVSDTLEILIDGVVVWEWDVA